MTGLVYDRNALVQRTGAALESGLLTTLRRAHEQYSSVAHILTGDMLEKSFAVAETRGDRAVGKFGTDSLHGIYEEEGHTVHARDGDYWWEGHHQYRDALDGALPGLGADLRAAFERGGA